MDIDWGSADTGMDVAEKLYRISPETKIIYVTGYNERFSQHIFLHPANLSGYLTKPVDPALLEVNLQKVCRTPHSGEPSLVLYPHGQPMVLPFQDIVYVESRRHNVIIYTGKETITVYGKLSSVLEQMSDDFFQCHKSYAVNMAQVMPCRLGKVKLILPTAFAFSMAGFTAQIETWTVEQTFIYFGMAVPYTICVYAIAVSVARSVSLRKFQGFYLVYMLFPLSLVLVFYFYMFSAHRAVWVTGTVCGIAADIILLIYTVSQEEKTRLEEQLRESRHMMELERAHYQAVESRREEKGHACEVAGIRLESELTLPGDLAVEPIHLCSIFSNLLDNAIRGAAGAQVEEPVISLKSRNEGDYVFICVVNPSAPPRNSIENQ